MNYFFDTSAALLLQEAIFNTSDTTYISTHTFKELEEIKSSNTKSDDIKAKARRLLHLLYERESEYETLFFDREKYNDFQEKLDLPKTPDTKILSCIINIPSSDVTFVTADLYQYKIAKSASISAVYIKAQPEDNYKGYKEYYANTNEDILHFYEMIDDNDNSELNLLTNEYLILFEADNSKPLEAFKWTGEEFVKIEYPCFTSDHFGEIKPKNIYQKLAMDSMKNNQITLIGGPAGSGKTWLSFGYLFDQLEHNMIDRIVIFCNPVVAKNAAKLGFYPGTQTEKILSSQVGNVLVSKLGSIIEVESLITKGVLQIIPAGDSRGYEVPARSGVYLMEAQNLDTVLLRMLLQRIGEDCKVIVDGDRQEQTDLDIYANNNGMRKMSEVFRGESIFGQVDLKTIERSHIAKIAERMK